MSEVPSVVPQSGLVNPACDTGHNPCTWVYNTQYDITPDQSQETRLADLMLLIALSALPEASCSFYPAPALLGDLKSLTPGVLHQSRDGN